MSHPPVELSYVRLYADANGASRFVDEQHQLATSGATTGEAKLPVLKIDNVSGAAFVALRRDEVEDWHLAPRRQYLIVLRGEVEVTASSGESRRFRPGNILLVEDTHGKGHITRSVGVEDHVVIAVPAPK